MTKLVVYRGTGREIWEIAQNPAVNEKDYDYAKLIVRTRLNPLKTVYNPAER